MEDGREVGTAPAYIEYELLRTLSRSGYFYGVKIILLEGGLEGEFTENSVDLR